MIYRHPQGRVSRLWRWSGRPGPRADSRWRHCGHGPAWDGHGARGTRPWRAGRAHHHHCRPDRRDHAGERRQRSPWRHRGDQPAWLRRVGSGCRSRHAFRSNRSALRSSFRRGGTCTGRPSSTSREGREHDALLLSCGCPAFCDHMTSDPRGDRLHRSSRSVVPAPAPAPSDVGGSRGQGPGRGVPRTLTHARLDPQVRCKSKAPPARRDHWEGVHDRDRVGQFLGGGGLDVA